MKGIPNPRRAELRALSMALKPTVKAGIFQNVNEAIRAHYSAEVGCGEWNTFKGWLDAGRPVRKGEQGFPVWAAPRARKPGEGDSFGGDLAQLAALNGVEPGGPQWFPVAYIFHAGQVEQAELVAA